MKPLYAFLDTNIFLHYQPFEQIKWTEILNAHHVVLVATPIVVRELDKHKDQHRISAIQDRARTALKKIEQITLGEMATRLPDGVELEYAKEPTVDFQQYGLRPENNDDNLVANCLTCRDLESNANVVLIAGDTGPRLKARQHGIAAMSLPEKYKLPSTLDATEKEKKKLQQRVQQLENRLPKLKLAFANEANQLNATLLQPIAMTEEEIQRRVTNIKSKYRKRKRPVVTKSELSPGHSPLTSLNKFQGLVGNFNDFSGPSSEEFARYNDELDGFYEDYEIYLRECVVNHNLQRRTVRLDLCLFNYGTAPAGDIDVFLHFPDGFDLYDEDDKPQVPEAPDPPRPPRTQAEMMQDRLSLHDLSYRNLSPTYLPTKSNVSAPEIKRSNSYEVSYEVQRLKQHMNEPFDPLCVVFDSFESAASFRIDYRINAADLPEETTGSLHTVITRASDNN